MILKERVKKEKAYFQKNLQKRVAFQRDHEVEKVEINRETILVNLEALYTGKNSMVDVVKIEFWKQLLKKKIDLTLLNPKKELEVLRKWEMLEEGINEEMVENVKFLASVQQMLGSNRSINILAQLKLKSMLFVLDEESHALTEDVENLTKKVAEMEKKDFIISDVVLEKVSGTVAEMEKKEFAIIIDFNDGLDIVFQKGEKEKKKILKPNEMKKKKLFLPQYNH
ncbi:hypothetical protein L2E82_31818 [Cichorium intybus]|uniref:Uncharacterized protein n=1 Tax=Cichorium intybus TaxID=13427 RepID=A0ACB9BFH3_CICIN|nr:hypothetical protein L2E82_31818 [Cichorium intybus]